MLAIWLGLLYDLACVSVYLNLMPTCFSLHVRHMLRPSHLFVYYGSKAGYSPIASPDPIARCGDKSCWCRSRHHCNMSIKLLLNASHKLMGRRAAKALSWRPDTANHIELGEQLQVTDFYFCCLITKKRQPPWADERTWISRKLPTSSVVLV